MRKILLSALLLILLAATGAFAHPHVRMKSCVTLDFNGTQCEGCRIQWEFDDFFSGSTIHDFDKNRDGQFDEKEMKNLYNNQFKDLVNYGYFVFFRKGTARNNPDTVKEFKAWQKDGVLYYSFFVPFTKLKYDDDFYIAIFDRSFYCSITYEKTPVIINQKNGVSPAYEIITNKKYPVYYNPLGAADDMTLYKKWKPGLETAYPDEIHIYFKR